MDINALIPFETAMPGEYFILIPLTWLVLPLIYLGFARLSALFFLIGSGQFYFLEFVFRGSKTGRIIEFACFSIAFFALHNIAIRRAEERLRKAYRR